ncbi:sel1 repeat family protein [Pelagibaculum spongiae]|uniref:Sel1 repeat family protein n=1 Tax=Pelagibaculum spongiae TaxID=2080658 RepID=A0A2V1GTS1_9GAMM|nr:sel1 repeat family protein [Pelagibaculum spongiae]PVZ66651.1 hypothetical protein DC094_15385 [Pelagibaculum spongiae]
MKFKFLFALAIIFSSSAFAEKCKLEHLTELEYTDIECQFYLGTAAYRNQVYSAAVAHWKYIIESPVKYEGDSEIKASALSTVTFLIYHGLGVKKDRFKAVSRWKDAVKSGDLEARRHLGFAYSDANFRGKNLVEALGWYESIFLLVPNPEVLNESDQAVFNDAVEGSLKLKEKLSDRQQEKAKTFARTIL